MPTIGILYGKNNAEIATVITSSIHLLYDVLVWRVADPH
jgi:hypothetical protein